jgi:hypothetical protein
MPTVICTKCNLNTPAYPGSSWCEPCHTELGRKRRAKRKAEGFCTQCGSKEKLTNGTFKCDPCRYKDIVNARTIRIKWKQAAIEFLGGKCLDCGLVTNRIEVYDFHHKDPSLKSFNVCSRFLKKAWGDIVEELTKCELLCANCHRIREKDLDDQRLEELTVGIGVLRRYHDNDEGRAAYEAAEAAVEKAAAAEEVAEATQSPAPTEQNET